jgi:hypothetical protein
VNNLSPHWGKTSMVRSFCLALCLIAAASGAWAQSNKFRPHANHENAAEERACSGDAHRFCRQEIPDQFRVASCLQEHRDRLSRACRTVLEGHGM